jgi:signal transduction histidine kinase
MSVRTRFTLLYGALFLFSGAVLLAIVASFGARTAATAPTPGVARSVDLARVLAEAERQRSQSLLYGALVALAVMLLLSMVLGYAAAWRVVRPLRTITAATQRISADNLHERLAVSGPADEVKALADTIDELLARLEQSFAAQRRFVADASHELRTPVATMRASLDVAEAKPESVPPVLASRLRVSLNHVEGLIDGFLMLARAQHGALDSRTVVSLGDLAEQALLVWDDDVPITGDAFTEGNPVLLARMVANVVDNAVLYCPPGGKVSVYAGSSEGQAWLVVLSDGEMLDPVQVERLGKPFQRLGADRTGTGTGLGLAIVAAIVSAHGGTLDLRARATGGLQVTIRLASS